MHKFTKSALVHYLLPCTKTAGKVKLVTYCAKKPKLLLLIYIPNNTNGTLVYVLYMVYRPPYENHVQRKIKQPFA